MASVTPPPVLPDAGAQPPRPTRRPSLRGRQPRTLLWWGLLAFLALVVLYPLALLFIESFRVGLFGQDTTWGLENWRAALTEPRLRASLWNTVALAVTRQVFSLLIAFPIAWLIARTNLPGRKAFEFSFWVGFFMPTLTVVLGYIILFDDFRGLANGWLEALPFIDEGPFDIFSWWGIIFAHLVTSTVASKVMLLTPVLRNMDAAMEEASRVSGASTIRAVGGVVIPVMAPAIMVVTLLSLIRSLEAFEVELILGAPDRIHVFSTLIYEQVHQDPPAFGRAIGLSMIVLSMMVPFIIAQQWYTRRHDRATITGKQSNQLHDLGRWRRPMFVIVAFVAAFLTVIPAVLVVMSSFMNVFGFFDIPEPWTLNNWREGLASPLLMNGLRNTLLIGVSAAVIAMALYSLIAYASARANFVGRGLLDFVTWLPSTIPGIVMSLGFLWLFVGTALFRPMYGTIYILVVVVVLSSMTVGVQIVKVTMIQLGSELEEAGWTCGGSWFHTLRRVVLPAVAPSVLLVGILTFATAARATSVVALVTTGGTEPLSIVQLNHMADGSFETASVIGVLILALTVGVAMIGRKAGLRLGPR